MRGPDGGVVAADGGGSATFVVCSPDVSLLLRIKCTFVKSWLSPAADGVLFSFFFFRFFRSTLRFPFLSSMAQVCVMSLGLFILFRGP